MTTKVKYNEQEFIELLRLSDQQAFALLYDNYAGALLGIIKKIVSEPNAANDILQEVFIKIWSKRLNYNSDKGRLFTWMVSIARNSSIDYLRSKQSKFDEKIMRNDGIINQVNHSGSTETNIDAIGIKAFINNLGEEHRKLIDLAYFEGYTQEEIAIKLQIPLGTVKTRIRSALTTLRGIVN